MNNCKEIFVTRSSMPSYEEYCEAIKPLWESRWLTNMGEYHQRLEKELADYLDVPQISLMVNGHMALEMVIQTFDFPRGSEVITTPFTFISTTHAIVRNGLKPVFCDIKLSDGTIDENKIEDLITENTVAILPVHVYGNICNVEAIQTIADKYNLKVIYDAAHAFGEKLNGKGVGNFGDASIFSFHATKVFHTIEGGAVACKNQEIYEKLYNLKNFGIRDEELVVSVGANAKMNEFSAIMGLCNLKHIDDVIDSRKECYEYYQRRLRNTKGVKIFEMQDGVKKNYGYMPIIVEDDFRLKRDELNSLLRANGIFPRKYFFPITSDHACFKNKYKTLELVNSRYLSERILLLPLFDELTLDQIDFITDLINI